jgi:hypothetical protein
VSRSSSWARVSAGSSPSAAPAAQLPVPSQGPGWYRSKRLTWAVALGAGGGSIFIEGLSERFVFGSQHYNLIRHGSADGTANVLALMQAAISGSREVDVQLDAAGWVVSAALATEPGVPMPAAASVEGSGLRLPSSTAIDGKVRGAYATADSSATWIFVDGTGVPSANMAGGARQPVRGWVMVDAEEQLKWKRLDNWCHRAAK